MKKRGPQKARTSWNSSLLGITDRTFTIPTHERSDCIDCFLATLIFLIGMPVPSPGAISSERLGSSSSIFSSCFRAVSRLATLWHRYKLATTCDRIVAHAAPATPIPSGPTIHQSSTTLSRLCMITAARGATLSLAPMAAACAIERTMANGTPMARTVTYCSANGTVSVLAAPMTHGTTAGAVRHRTAPTVTPRMADMDMMLATMRRPPLRSPRARADAKRLVVATLMKALRNTTMSHSAVAGPSAASAMLPQYRPTKAVSTRLRMGVAR
mmetsp:Transcript_49333/g.120335  ORF Transcript_49333/g.120335 Transcript_49333/m.120335 type:complete len:270 (-) Transcript_49333:588-1397(-)